MQFYLINIRPKLHHRKWENYASHCLSTEKARTCYFRYAVWETI